MRYTYGWEIFSTASEAVMIIAGMATIPSRKNMVWRAIASLLPQIDHLHLTLNGYDKIPDPMLRSDKITVILDSKNSMADNAKLLGLEGQSCYYFTVDDDIIYPHDYVAKMIEHIEKYKRQAVVGVHGIIYSNPMRQYLKDRIVFTNRKALNNDKRVHALGTGTVGFHTEGVAYTVDDIPRQVCMLDVHFAGWCKEHNIHMMTISRPANWLTMLSDKSATSIWDKTVRQPKFRNDIKTAINHYGPWPDLGAL